ncbi:hypothetical protein LXL04_025446 [Taraxacum kok-saghyz]
MPPIPHIATFFVENTGDVVFFTHSPSNYRSLLHAPNKNWKEWTTSEQRRGHITTLPLAKDVERWIAAAKAANDILHRHPYTAPLSDI